MFIKSQSPIVLKNTPNVTQGNLHYCFMSFGDYLAGKMRDLGVRAADLAKRAGTSKQNIGRIVNNTPHPLTGAPPKVSVEMVDRLSKALGINGDEARLAAGYAPKTETPTFNLAESAL